MTSQLPEIGQLAHHKSEQALKIWSLFNAAYQLEAEWLEVTNFPPLERTIQDIQGSDTEFWGLTEQSILKAVTEFTNHGSWIEVHSLAVSPAYLRTGHGRAILTFLLGHFPDRIIEVETALKNRAALSLYQSAGFKVISQYETREKLIKVLFRKTPTQAAIY